MKRAMGAILAAAAIVAASSVWAQERGPATDGARAGERGARLSTEDRAAMADARIAAFHAGLRLTPEQEKNWPTVESALREFSKQRNEMRERMRDARGASDPIARLRAAADAMGERSTGLKRLADASEPLYRSLDDGQKRRLTMLTRQMMRPQFGPRRGSW